MTPRPVMQLADYDNSWFHPGGSVVRRMAWFFVGQPIVASGWIPFSKLRVTLLRLFGARIGAGVVVKPSVQVKYPWHLVVGDHCWIGEHVWIDNLTTVRLESNVCLSQGAYLCTGNHDWSDPAFGLIIAPIHLAEGSWAGAKSILTPGCVLSRGAVAAAGAVIHGVVPEFEVHAGNPARCIKHRAVQERSSVLHAHSKERGVLMKILFINQFYWPDSSASSQQLTDLTVGLAARGHNVTVLCSEGGYATAASSQPPVGVHVLRVKALQFGRGKLSRMLSYLSFYVTAAARGLFAKRADLVICLTTPPLIALVGLLIKVVRGSRFFEYEQDLYPDVAVDLGMFAPGGFTAKATGWLIDFVRRHADGLIALGPCMRDRLIARGVPAAKVFVAENWASSEAITPMPRPGNAEQLVLLYSGNLGLAHDLETLTGAMDLLRGDARFRFLFVGSGGRRQELMDHCDAHDIRSVEFRPYVPRDQLSEGLALGDIGLVTQRADCCGSVIPSKLYGILAAGRPLLFIGPKTATPALVIARHDCGWHIAPGDIAGLHHLLLHLADNRRIVREAGERARQALVQHYDLPQSIARFDEIISAPPERQAQVLQEFAVPQNVS